MNDGLSNTHELEVLAAFDKMTADFKSGTRDDAPDALESINKSNAEKASGTSQSAAVSDETRIYTPAEDFSGFGSNTVVLEDIVSEAHADEFARDDSGSSSFGFASAKHSASHSSSKKSSGSFSLKKSSSSKADTKAAEKTSQAAAGKSSARRHRSDKNAGEKKTRRKKNKGISILWKVLLLLILLAFAGAIIGGAIAISYVKSVVADTPDINPSNIYDLLTENSILLDNEGNTIEYVYSGDALRTNIEYKDMPENLINAFVAIEDKTFWTHHGINYVRIIGAIRDAIRDDSQISGTSTITQQLSRNLYLTDIKSKRTLERKLQEMYYTFIIEDALSKEQIIEAYLNTIYLGYNSDGVAAASQAYFSKDVSELDLIECAILAALPKNPNGYAPIKRIATDEVENESDYDIITQNDEWTVYYNAEGEERVHLVLRMMYEQGYIDEATYTASKEADLRSFIKPGDNILTGATSSYFADYVVDEVVDDLCLELDMTESEARSYLYNGGLIINSTLDTDIQNIMEEAYADPANFPDVGDYTSDKDGNVLDSNGKILLYNKANMFDEEGNYTILADEYEWQSNGDLKLFGGKRLNFYKTSVQGEIDYSIEFKSMFEYDTVTDDEGNEKEIFYSIAGGTWTIAAQYKNRDDSGDLYIDSSFFADKPDFISEGPNGTLILNAKYGKEGQEQSTYSLKQRVMQPQSAMTIIDYATGYIVGMVGGRGVEGKLLYNRATSTRQPGSSIKPLAVYSVALAAGKEGRGNFTAATPLDDAPICYGGSPWPSNWYTGYKGMTNLRNAVEQSINTCAVNLYMQLDPYECVETLQNMGISTVVTAGNVNDINASALALGGMTNGISPLEMTAAYGTFGNYGLYVEPISYTTVCTRQGDVILSNTPETTRVFDEDVASLMLDILHTTVTHGLGSGAKLESQPTAGKTGTTSERYDVWFCGLTPKYSASVWIGNDTNISLGSGSSAATSLWSAVMEQVGAMDEPGEFELRGEFVTRTVDRHSGMLLSSNSNYGDMNCSLTEIFIAGTEPTEADTSHSVATVCAETGYLATPWCPSTKQTICTTRPGGMSWEKMIADYQFKKGVGLNTLADAVYDKPEYYCPIHNHATDIYPISPVYTEGATKSNPLEIITDELEYELDENGEPIAEDPELGTWDEFEEPLDDSEEIPAEGYVNEDGVFVWDESYNSEDPNF